MALSVCTLTHTAYSRKSLEDFCDQIHNLYWKNKMIYKIYRFFKLRIKVFSYVDWINNTYMEVFFSSGSLPQVLCSSWGSLPLALVLSLSLKPAASTRWPVLGLTLVLFPSILFSMTALDSESSFRTWPIYYLCCLLTIATTDLSL